MLSVSTAALAGTGSSEAEEESVPHADKRLRAKATAQRINSHCFFFIVFPREEIPFSIEFYETDYNPAMSIIADNPYNFSRHSCFSHLPGKNTCRSRTHRFLPPRVHYDVVRIENNGVFVEHSEQRTPIKWAGRRQDDDLSFQ
jgi:hypothetical protein